MKSNLNYSVIVISILSGILYITLTNPILKSGADWSEPVLLYYHPEKYVVSRFDVDVNDGSINAGAAYHLSNDVGRMEYSGIYHIRKEPGRDPEVERVSQGNVPSESPSVFRDSSGKLHFFWGARLQDPNFEAWLDNVTPSGNFSTDIMHYMPDNENYAEPEHFYAGNLGVSRNSHILFPINITEDSEGRLNVVCIADSVFNAGGEIPFPLFIKQNSEGQGNTTRFLGNHGGGGSSVNIVSLDENQLLVTFLASHPNQHSVNDVLAVYSNDGGLSWSDTELVSLSGMNPGWNLRVAKAPDGRVHLLWGKGLRTGFPSPDAIFHCFTDDGGKTWSEPELVFRLGGVTFRPPGAPAPDRTLLHIFYNYEILTDSYGQLHWVGSAIRYFESGKYEFPFFYSSWSPATGQWEEFTKLELTDNPGWVSLAYDNKTNELYTFWGDSLETDQQALYYSKKSLTVNITDPPAIRYKGHLVLHSNYPNPFSSATTVPFTLETGGRVVLSVYDITGRKISSENLGVKPPGYHEHNITFRGQNSGTYFYEVTLDGKYRQQKNMVYFK